MICMKAGLEHKAEVVDKAEAEVAVAAAAEAEAGPTEQHSC